MKISKEQQKSIESHKKNVRATLIITRMHDCGMLFQDYARACGIPISTLRRYIYGDSEPPYGVAVKMAEVLLTDPNAMWIEWKECEI